jgi:CRISPR-associated protein Csb2
MSQHLVLTIRFHDQRYHGTSEWPPAPARVFQALVAGTARGNALPASAAPALEWLETLPPPIIAAPRARLGSRVDLFVPNNDADSAKVLGDPARVGEIRVKKLVQPRLFEAEALLLYAWPIPAETRHLSTLLEVATELYQLGRGVDQAWAVAELIDAETLSLRLSQHWGTIHQPGMGEGSSPLACPGPGSLASLVRRHELGATRLRTVGEGKHARLLFSQPPKPRFVPVNYRGLGHRFVYELRNADDPAKLWPSPLARVVTLIERLRDGAATRLRDALPEHAELIESTVVGRKADKQKAAPIEERVRIVPLPSIGHQHVDPAVRRVLIEVPSHCPLQANDVQWAFSGLEPINPDTGEVGPFALTKSNDRNMLDRYAPEKGGRRWTSVTAVALPEPAQRRRIEPARRQEEAKGAKERIEEEGRACGAVYTALRHAGVRKSPVAIRVQREPFEARGARAEAFAEGTRFHKHRLWHVEISFQEPIAGPLVIGDGRFLGLGVMAPFECHAGVHAFHIEDGLVSAPAPVEVARALRRAVMARVQAKRKRNSPLPKYFSGHEANGDPASDPQHLAFAFDPPRKRLLVLAPHAINRRDKWTKESAFLDELEEAMVGFGELRAGPAGLLKIRPVSMGAQTDPLFETSRSWESLTPYQVTRHAKHVGASEAFSGDLRAECRRRGLPDPHVTPANLQGIPGVGLSGTARLDFETAIQGPLLLGRNRHLGGGLFAPVKAATASLGDSHPT